MRPASLMGTSFYKSGKEAAVSTDSLGERKGPTSPRLSNPAGSRNIGGSKGREIHLRNNPNSPVSPPEEPVCFSRGCLCQGEPQEADLSAASSGICSCLLISILLTKGARHFQPFPSSSVCAISLQDRSFLSRLTYWCRRVGWNTLGKPSA